MAFYKLGLAFLAGTGFGAAVTNIRNDRCPLHRQQHCRHCHHHHHRCDAAAAAKDLQGKGEGHEYYGELREKKSKDGRRCPKKGGGKEETKGDQASYDKESSD